MVPPPVSQQGPCGGGVEQKSPLIVKVMTGVASSRTVYLMQLGLTLAPGGSVLGSTNCVSVESGDRRGYSERVREDAFLCALPPTKTHLNATHRGIIRTGDSELENAGIRCQTRNSHCAKTGKILSVIFRMMVANPDVSPETGGVARLLQWRLASRPAKDERGDP